MADRKYDNLHLPYKEFMQQRQRELQQKLAVIMPEGDEPMSAQAVQTAMHDVFDMQSSDHRNNWLELERWADRLRDKYAKTSGASDPIIFDEENPPMDTHLEASADPGYAGECFFQNSGDNQNSTNEGSQSFYAKQRAYPSAHQADTEIAASNMHTDGIFTDGDIQLLCYMRPYPDAHDYVESSINMDAEQGDSHISGSAQRRAFFQVLNSCPTNTASADYPQCRMTLGVQAGSTVPWRFEIAANAENGRAYLYYKSSGGDGIYYGTRKPSASSRPDDHFPMFGIFNKVDNPAQQGGLGGPATGTLADLVARFNDLRQQLIDFGLLAD